MRVLLLHRQAYGGINSYVQCLSEALQSLGIDLVAQDATNWIPNETGPLPDRITTKELRDRAAGF